MMDEKYARDLLSKTQRDYNLIADDFSRTRAGPPTIIFQKSLKDYVKDGDRILDLGCGNGRLLEAFEGKNIEYFGIDNSEKLIEMAKRKYPKANFRVADALNLPFGDNYFDKIYSIAVFHQIPSEKFRVKFLKETKRVLKREGLLILTVWYILREAKAWKLIFKHSLLKIVQKSKLDFGDIFLPWKNSKGQIMAERYYHCFTREELAKMVKRVNFKIEETGILKHPERHYNIYLIAKK